MDVHDVVATTRDALTARRVFGEPYESGGVTVIPAAVLRGGVGGGGADERGQRREGGGFGLVAAVWLVTVARRDAGVGGRS